MPRCSCRQQLQKRLWWQSIKFVWMFFCILMVVFDLPERQRYPQIFSILGSFETSSASIDGLVSSAVASACLCSMYETVICQIIPIYNPLFNGYIYIYTYYFYVIIYVIKYTPMLYIHKDTIRETYLGYFFHPVEKKHHLPRVHSWVPNCQFFVV